MTMCRLCDMRREVDALRAKQHLEHVDLRSVLIAEEPDRTVARIYKPLTPEHRQRLLDLLSEISRTK